MFGNFFPNNKFQEKDLDGLLKKNLGNFIYVLVY